MKKSQHCLEHTHEHHSHGCGCSEHNSQCGVSALQQSESQTYDGDDEVEPLSEHGHQHEAACGCGHEHQEQVHGHSENCDVCGESLVNCICEMSDTDCVKKIYTLENLGCANCAAKMEKAINDLPEVSSATITYTTKRLRLTTKYHAQLLPQIQEICSKIESGVKVVERTNSVLSENSNQHKKNSGILSMSEEQRSLAEIILGGILFVISEFAGIVPEAYHIYSLIVAYILLGGRIVWTAGKNITQGQVFDENFLMTIATLGAFVINQYEEAVGVMLFYRIGEYFEHRAVEKSRGQIMEAVDMRPETVNLLVGEEVRIISPEEAGVGDILLVRAGDRIPLDGVVVEGESLIDTSPVTGEPVPVKRAFGDEVVSGCVNTSGMLKIRVEKVLAESMVTKILDSVENAAANKPQLDRFITRFARVYTPFVVGVAVLVAVVPGFITGNWEHWIYTALTFLVISCPCALVLSVPLTFFSGIGAGSKYGILFKGGVTIEALKNIKAVVMDKTGTLTKGNFVVQKLLPIEGVTEQKLLEICASAEQASNHPIARSIVAASKKQNLELLQPQIFEEIAGEGLVVETIDGRILCGNEKLLNRFDVDFSAQKLANYGTSVLVAADGKYLGQIIIDDTLKDDATEAVQVLHKMQLNTVMLTGDTESSAQAVAKAVGIKEVRAKLLPQDKLNELNRLRENFGAVMFVGDGINDAPVLAGADVGAAMGSGSDSALEAADVVFMNSEMKAIPQAIAIARETNRVAWQNVVFALVVKAIIMAAGLAGYASMWAAVFADTGVSLICVLNAVRILYKKV